ncbi:MAG: hypothetical protein LR017_02780 [Candidatus Pacebacteria bacterium]|nr:hypothetical protein [Candidatus Paceibacterota bacterium]
MKFLIGNLILLLSLPFFSYADTLNAGFVDGLWYSQENIFVGDTVRIYVALRNNTESDLMGTVRFFDNDIRIDTMQVHARSGRLVEAWADWSPTYGAHTIRAELAHVQLDTIGESTKLIPLAGVLAEDTRSIDYDTDGDGTGDTEDYDDDNDGMSDTEEREAGTDPKVFNKQPHADDTADTATEDAHHSTDTQQTTTTAPTGLEVLTTESRVGTMLSAVTQTINHTKARLDTYRAARTQKQTHVATSTPAAPIASSTVSDTHATITRTHMPQEPSFMENTMTVLGHLTGAFYTGVLAMLSFILGYPALVEFVLLVGILFFVYRFARSMGKRPID